MFYYLLYNSSFSFIVENRLFSTILYGSILYILTHAVLNYCDISILNIVNNYYWTLFTLDIISFVYAFYQSITDNNNSNNELNVSFNLLKNKINTIIDRKNDLTVTHSTVLNKNIGSNNNSNNNSNNSNNSNNNNINNNNNNNNSNSNNNNNAKQKNINTQPLQSANKFSTPISQLQNINQGSNQQSNQSSTPISLIRNVNVVEPNIDLQDDQFNQYAESNTGSDLGSLMDLSDFETSL